MTAVSSFSSTRLDLPPSCIAFCPQAPTLFVVGTYFLEAPAAAEKEGGADNSAAQPEDDAQQQHLQGQKRSGSLVTFEISPDGTLIEQLSTVHLDGGVLDIQWQPPYHHHHHQPLLAVATSTGQLQFYTFDITSKSLSHFSTHLICDPATLVLSLQWHPRQPTAIGVTLSDGRVCLAYTDNDSSSTTTAPWSATAKIELATLATHSLEAWILAFGPSTSSSDGNDEELLLYSGGDDAVLSCTSLPTPLSPPPVEEEQAGVPLWQDRRTHQAGVTYILPLTPALVLTGSYDDHLRLLRVPDSQPGGMGGMRRRRMEVLAEVCLGGGVWRVKVLEGDVSSGRILILASCMYAGARVVRLQREHPATSAPDSAEGEDEGAWTFEMVATFEEHESMNYGSEAFQPAVVGEAGSSNGGAAKTIISTSFYDKLMCLWKVPVDS